MKKTTEDLMHTTFMVAKSAQKNGNLPYGCILVDASGEVIMRGENTVVTEQDALGHAEINLIREASKQYSADYLATCTIYTSDEPCPMCSSAIFWGGVGHLVYGLSKRRFYDEFGRGNPAHDFDIPSATVLDAGARKVTVSGPLLEEEALKLHR